MSVVLQWPVWLHLLQVICFYISPSGLLLLIRMVIRRLSPLSSLFPQEFKPYIENQQFCVHILFVHILGVIAFIMIYCT